MVLVLLCGLDHSLWSESSDALPSLRGLAPPVRVYGVSNADLSAPGVCGAFFPHLTSSVAVQSLLSFMHCKQAHLQPRKQNGGKKADPTKRKSTAVAQRASPPFPVGDG